MVPVPNPFTAMAKKKMKKKNAIPISAGIHILRRQLPYRVWCRHVPTGMLPFESAGASDAAIAAWTTTNPARSRGDEDGGRIEAAAVVPELWS